MKTLRCEICDSIIIHSGVTYCAGCEIQRTRDVDGKSHALDELKIAGRLRRLARLIEALGSESILSDDDFRTIDGSLDLLESDLEAVECQTCGKNAFDRMLITRDVEDFQNCPGCDGFHCGACMDAAYEASMADDPSGEPDDNACPASPAVRENM